MIRMSNKHTILCVCIHVSLYTGYMCSHKTTEMRHPHSEHAHDISTAPCRGTSRFFERILGRSDTLQDGCDVEDALEFQALALKN